MSCKKVILYTCCGLLNVLIFVACNWRTCKRQEVDNDHRNHTRKNQGGKIRQKTLNDAKWFIETSIDWCYKNRKEVAKRLRKAAVLCEKRSAEACMALGEGIYKFVRSEGFIITDSRIENTFKVAKRYWDEPGLSFIVRACDLGNGLACFRKELALRDRQKAYKAWKNKRSLPKVIKKCMNSEFYACYLLSLYVRRLYLEKSKAHRKILFDTLEVWLSKQCKNGWCRACLTLANLSEVLKNKRKIASGVCRSKFTRLCSKMSISFACSFAADLPGFPRNKRIELLKRAAIYGDGDHLIDMKSSCFVDYKDELRKKCSMELEAAINKKNGYRTQCGLNYRKTFAGIKMNVSP